MEYNSIYGVIKIDRDYAKSVAYIKSIGEDPFYPFINTNMFGLGEYVRPYYYENMLITFGTTYKNFGYRLIDWNLFILKIENILRNIDFKHAKFHIDSYTGDFVFYWVNKSKVLSHWQNDYKKDEWKLIETDEFYFGFGDRPLTTPDPDDRYKKELDELDWEGFSYPVKFSEEALHKVEVFNKKMQSIQIGTTVKFQEVMGEKLDDRIFEILYDLKLKGYYSFQHYGEITVLKHA